MNDSTSPCFSGKTVLITGSGGGLGLVLATGFYSRGANIILNGRDLQKLERAAHVLRTIAGSPGTIRCAAFDVTQEREIEEAVPRMGPIDILVNNAGIQRRGPLEKVSTQIWDEVLRTNLSSAFWVARAIVPTMIENRSGKILNVCSLMSDLGRPGTGPYTASKGGLKMLTKAMCADWAQYNIQINGIAPGYFITEMTQSLAADPQFDGWIKRRTPAGRWGNPEELVGAAAFLCSDEASFINGQVLCIDGGMTSVL